MPRQSAIAILAVLGFVGGCDSGPKPRPPAAPAEPLSLHLLVIDDPALARQIGRYRGEWKARSGAELTISEATSAELEAILAPAETLLKPKASGLKPSSLEAISAPAADAIIYPSEWLGTFCERNWIRPIAPAWLDRSELHQDEFFDPAGTAELKWGGELCAVPLGSPVFVCFYRRDLLERLHRSPPRTWREYQELAKLLDDRQNLPGVDLPEDWRGSLEPLAPGWAGKSLLARAAAYAKHRDYYATLWDRETMSSQIASPPFVRALDELVASAGQKPTPSTGHTATSVEMTPTDVRQAILVGHCGLAISWPAAATAPGAVGDASQTVRSKSPTVDIGICQLPGSPEAYNPREKSWQPRPPDEDPHLPLLAIAGRIGSVTKGSKSPQLACQFLEWLSSDKWGAQISPASPATAPYRHGQIARADRWVDRDLSAAAAKEYGEAIQISLARSQWLLSPRIPGHFDYMTALDQAVRSAVIDGAPSAGALKKAASDWDQITDRLGREKQRLAYRRSLGLED